jgi:hypothetical protein
MSAKHRRRATHAAPSDNDASGLFRRLSREIEERERERKRERVREIERDRDRERESGETAGNSREVKKTCTVSCGRK